MTAAALDIATIVAPLAGEAPAGADLRADGALSASYHMLRDARAAARAAERRAVYEEEDVDAGRVEATQAWRGVAAQAAQLLGETSKDLEVAAWLSEALLRLRGFQGLRDGFRVIAGLVDSFWDDLHPLPDGDGLQRRLSAVAGLNGEGTEGAIIAPIRMVPLIPSMGGAFTLWHYQCAARIERLTPVAAREAAMAEAGFSLEDIVSAARALPANERHEIFSAIVEAHAAVQAAGAALDRAAGEAAPSLRQIVDVLEEAREACRYLGLAPEGGVIATADNAPVGSTPSSGDSCRPADGVYASREAALAEILSIAAYLRRIEPHSLISYTLEEAVRRARLPLIDLLPELIPDGQARRRFLMAAGVRQADDDGE
ncbi:type VI secretion system protein TssA [Chelatococcus asaccharovorans]|uniref:Type VI secretion system protein ImpA n=1 Tax=Chelatococcus asaccharovorans TaxID=28210 RepID=A0A2V3UIA5_9HYPH|nr:type VI secretion system protein TssA [Chelatococcus asaccharovorans]MBS7706451.1 type VI secretion system protein TssA [Chelatococcus asaccharovorans]PXW64906.1 type VI secretion system protein ImpA [Chelatococcus asaccharovorans]